MSKKEYEYVIIGAGIAGCSVAHFLSKYSDSILLVDKNSDVACGASGAAGAFLSPLLGKPNKFKELVTKALKFSTNFYLENISREITNCGVVRIPKNNEDKKKFQSYIPHMDFPFKEENDGYFFEIGSQVNSYNICKNLAKDVEKLFDYRVEKKEKDADSWILNDEIRAKNLILTTGFDTSLIDEKYFNIRAVWGQKIDIYTTTCISKNYHKNCSLSISKESSKDGFNKVSIGATHHRFEDELSKTNGLNNENERPLGYTLDTSKSDTEALLLNANDIQTLDNVEVCDIKVGARASSMDYFPMLGKLINSKKTLEKHPHLINGTHVKDGMLSFIENLFVLNGVGGRGFVLSPYLANQLVENIIKNNEIEEEVLSNRLFKRWVKKSKLKSSNV